MENLLGWLATFGMIGSNTATDITTKVATRGFGVLHLMALQRMAAAVVLLLVNIFVYPVLLTSPVVAIHGLVKSDMWWILPLDGGLNVIAFWFFIRAFKLSDASLVAPMTLFTPMLLLVTSPVMLGENIPFLGVLGVLVTVVGSYLMGFDPSNPKKILAPFVRLARDKGVQSMLATSAIWSVTSNLDKMGVQASSPVLWSGFFSVFMAACTSVLYLMLPKEKELKSARAWRGLLPGLTAAAVTLCQTYAISVMPVQYVIASKRMSSVTTVLASRLVFGEKIGNRLIGSTVMFLGVLLTLIVR